MVRIAFAIVIIASVACSHPSSVRNTQQEPLTARDSNFVTFDELQADVRQGHVFLYDALKSTRPGMLESARDRDWLPVYLLGPTQPFDLGRLSPVTLHSLERVPTGGVKWIRRYRSMSAPMAYRPNTEWLLVVALR